MKFEFSVFKFDYKNDYLPHYKKFFYDINKEDKLIDVLNSINKEENLAYENSDEFLVVVNGYYTKCDILLEDLEKKLGNDLIIEPISIKRCKTDLLIDDEDFKNKIEIFKDFIDEDDIKEYEKYKIYFYSSNTQNHLNDYIGDSTLLFAYDLIQKYPQVSDEILKIVSSYKYSFQFHTNLKNRLINYSFEDEKKFDFFLKRNLNNKDYSLKNNYFNEKDYEVDFNSEKINYYFDHFKIAFFNEKSNYDFLEKLKFKKIKNQIFSNDINKRLYMLNESFSKLLASEVLLTAFDSGCDFLLVDNLEDLYLFDSFQKEFSKIQAREFSLPIIHISELYLLASGEHKKVKQMLNKHKIDPEILP